MKQKIAELTDESFAPSFWNDQKKAAKKSQQLEQIRKIVTDWEQLEKDVVDLLELARVSRKEKDTSLKTDIEQKYYSLKKTLSAIRLETFLSGKYDDHNCLLSIHAGAGGTDAQDWAEMLLRMYLRYVESRGFKAEILDKSPGSEAGIKSVVIRIEGSNAYGYLKGEAGVHRLVRQSPFNPAHTRETSFALVEILPELETQEEKEIDPKDLKIETSTASGHGGQSVNTTYSAVRITHIPTGLKVSIQNERSQVQNKAQALKILQSKIQAHEEERQRQEKLKIRGEFHSAEWGNQIRSYVLHPYKLVKDHRTNLESTNPDSVLDGKIEEFIESYLEWNRKNK